MELVTLLKFGEGCDANPEPSRKNLMTETDKAYIAGFFDGEGCVGYYNAIKSNKKCNPAYHASVSISNTDPRVIRWIGDIVGVGRYNIIRFKDGKRRVAYQWQLGKRSDVIAFLVTIRPYLKVKGDQVDVLLAHFDVEASYTRKHGSVTPEIVEGRRKVSDELKRMKRIDFPEGVETRQAEPSVH